MLFSSSIYFGLFPHGSWQKWMEVYSNCCWGHPALVEKQWSMRAYIATQSFIMLDVLDLGCCETITYISDFFLLEENNVFTHGITNSGPTPTRLLLWNNFYWSFSLSNSQFEVITDCKIFQDIRSIPLFEVWITLYLHKSCIFKACWNTTISSVSPIAIINNKLIFR